MARILLVEDDEAIRMLVQSWLRARGNEVTLAGNGAQGLLLAKDRFPEIVVIDVFMPQVSGIDLCRSIRATPELKETYVVLITGQDAPQTEMAALEAGADDFDTPSSRGRGREWMRRTGARATPPSCRTTGRNRQSAVARSSANHWTAGPGARAG